MVSSTHFFQKKIDTYHTGKIEARAQTRACVLKNDHFLFPKGYPYKFGSLKEKNELKFAEIKEIWTDTFPWSAHTKKGELIFLIGLSEKDKKTIKSNQSLRTTTHQDNWSLILEEFLDTEFYQAEKERTFELLAKVGIGRKEVKNIRKSLCLRMYAVTMLSMEWVYYGQFDALEQMWPLSKKKYWWTMEIALKGMNKETRN